MVDDTLPRFDEVNYRIDHQPSKESFCIWVVDDVNRRRLSQPSQLPPREKLDADVSNTQVILVQQIALVCNRIQEEIQVNGQGLPTEATALERAQCFLAQQEEASEWTRDFLIGELITRLTDYLQVLGEPAPSDVDSSTDATVDAAIEAIWGKGMNSTLS